jgi:hypothetical protein
LVAIHVDIPINHPNSYGRYGSYALSALIIEAGKFIRECQRMGVRMIADFDKMSCGIWLRKLENNHFMYF